MCEREREGGERKGERERIVWGRGERVIEINERREAEVWEELSYTQEMIARCCLKRERERFLKDFYHALLRERERKRGR